MNDEDEKFNAARDYIFDRIEREGVAVVTLDDGTIFGFSLAMLERMVEDAKQSPDGRLIAFVQRRDVSKGEAS